MINDQIPIDLDDVSLWPEAAKKSRAAVFDLDEVFGVVADLYRVIVGRTDREMGSDGQRAFYLILHSVCDAFEATGKPVAIYFDIDRLRVGNCEIYLHVA